MNIVKQVYEIGGLLRGDFRSKLKAYQFFFEDFSWTEDKRFLDSTFYVRGDIKAIVELDEMIDSWNEG